MQVAQTERELLGRRVDRGELRPAERIVDGRFAGLSSGLEGWVTGLIGRPGEAAERLRATEERVPPALVGAPLAMEPPVAERAERGMA